ncbi:aldehyde dehydrogenase family protein [Haladaptatus sp.]|uniref:aldehyde dehydrogenase family protein n=1 Tax=Haladaptatus sp. TaxID=1973141 RepID=UPI003C58E748
MNHQCAIDDARSTGTFNAWINGSSTPAVSGETFETSDPVVDECIVTVPQCDEEDVDAAVDAARTGFNNTWSNTTPETPSQTLLEWVRVFDNHIAEFRPGRSCNSVQ